MIEIVTAYDRKPLGAVPLPGSSEIAADRRLRIRSSRSSTRRDAPASSPVATPRPAAAPP